MNALISLRKDSILEAMNKFEKTIANKGYSPSYAVGFYSSIIVHLASDRLQDTEYVIETLKSNTDLDLK